MSCVFYYLLTNPKLLEQARAEVDANFSSEEVVMDHTKLAEMPFLNACMLVFRSSVWSHSYICSNETLRLTPALLTALRRWVPKGSGGIVISGRYVSASV